MPACFALYRKGEKGMTHLLVVDEEIAAHLGIEMDKERWAANWYDTIGLLLALGKTFGEIKKLYAEEPIALKVIDFLDRNYSVQAWHEVGRRGL